MKNIYDISKGQLITAWVFGAIGVLLILDTSDSTLGNIVLVLIPFILIFYTIGWKNRKKRDNE